MNGLQTSGDDSLDYIVIEMSGVVADPSAVVRRTTIRQNDALAWTEGD